jgi:hypothetical protein
MDCMPLPSARPFSLDKVSFSFLYLYLLAQTLMHNRCPVQIYLSQYLFSFCYLGHPEGYKHFYSGTGQDKIYTSHKILNLPSSHFWKKIIKSELLKQGLVLFYIQEVILDPNAIRSINVLYVCKGQFWSKLYCI